MTQKFTGKAGPDIAPQFGILGGETFEEDVMIDTPDGPAILIPHGTTVAPEYARAIRASLTTEESTFSKEQQAAVKAREARLELKQSVEDRLKAEQEARDKKIADAAEAEKKRIAAEAEKKRGGPPKENKSLTPPTK